MRKEEENAKCPMEVAKNFIIHSSLFIFLLSIARFAPARYSRSEKLK